MMPRRLMHFPSRRLVAVIEFLEWTHDNHLRHPKFVSLRDDRDRRT
jgi:ATP-dependent DNA ligase